MKSSIKVKLASWIVALLLVLGSQLSQADLGDSSQPLLVSIDRPGELTPLPGYVFHPHLIDPHAKGPFPVVILMHGRAGPYNWGKRRGEVAADNLSARHRAWGLYWAKRGYIAIHVDSFSSRGYSRGFEKGSYFQRPAAVSEISVRPDDALAAYQWALQQPDVKADQIGIQGWSNGGSAVLATVLLQNKPSPFRFAIAFYPGCHKIRDLLTANPKALSTPLLLFCAGEDDEVEPQQCIELFEQLDGPSQFVFYPHATHSFDNPWIQSKSGNKAATEDAFSTTQEFVDSALNAH